MKIIGFGDSFINYSDFDFTYTNLIAKHFNTVFDHRGFAGSGTWDAYFKFEKFLKNNTPPDVVLFVWSASGRIYHPDIRDLCYNSVVLNPVEPKTPAHKPVYKAAAEYYKYLHHINKTDMEHTCLYHWIDTVLVPRYPNTKFIHMTSFPARSCDFGNPDEMEYLHDFTTAVELRPALIHLSYMDEWPGDLSKEHRTHHMTPKMHRILADTIIAAIEDYKPGLLNIKL
jgi:hypothetical protein